MDRLRTEMPGGRSGVHHSQVRKLDLCPSGNANLECGRALGFKGRRTSVRRGGGRSVDYDTGTVVAGLLAGQTDVS